MAYLSLYRQWRPQVFEDIVGQEHIVRTLKNAIANHRVVHAYMFSGPRGTGKTSTAKVFAKALNCSEGPTVKPCGKCVSCLAVKEGNALDVIEIDAASNRGIDEIRDLRDKVRFSPAQGRYKVYIIDEVHMLTMEAFNALLKTLEEPPSHAIFILATTEANRVPSTILSRCQRFDFNRLSVTQLSNHLAKVCNEIGVDYEQDALTLIARKAEGSARDALGLLEQVSGSDEKITGPMISEMLGATGFDRLSEIAKAIGEGSPGRLYPLVSDTLSSGTDPRQLLSEIGEHFMDLLLASECPDRKDLLHSGEESFAELSKSSGIFDKERLNAIIKAIGVGLAEISKAQNPRLTLELFLARIISMPAPDIIAGRQTAGEQAADSKGITSKATGQAAIRASSAQKSNTSAKAATKAEAAAQSAAIMENVSYTTPREIGKAESDTQKAPEIWNKVLEEVRKRSVKVEALARQGKPILVGMSLILEYSPDWSFHHQKMKEPSNEKAMAEAVKAVAGEAFVFECRLAEGAAKQVEVPHKREKPQEEREKIPQSKTKAVSQAQPSHTGEPEAKPIDEDAVQRSLEKAKALFSEVEIKIEEN